MLNTALAGLRPLERRDIVRCLELLAQHNAKLQMVREFSEEELAHALLPREDVVFSWVVEGDDGIVTDFFSFYSVPSSIVENGVIVGEIKNAYMYYTV